MRRTLASLRAELDATRDAAERNQADHVAAMEKEAGRQAEARQALMDTASKVREEIGRAHV